MSPLPTVGGDNGSWGTVLNAYLQTEHNADGTHKTSINTVATSGAAQNLSFNYDCHNITLSENCTFTFTDLPASGVLDGMLVKVTQGGSGGFTKAFPSSVLWPDGGTEPVMTPTTAGAISQYVIIWDGTSLSGVLRGDNFV